MIRRSGLYVIAIAAGIVLQARAAHAHPHVWIKVASEIVYDADGAITGIRHAWAFDDMFTTYALQGIHAKADGAYSREELDPLARTNIKSLKDADYFTSVEVDGEEQKLADPIDYYFEYNNEALVLAFHPSISNAGQAKTTCAGDIRSGLFHRVCVAGTRACPAGRRTRRVYDDDPQSDRRREHGEAPRAKFVREYQ
ncbi:ABC-type uncharacterized transport system substrate-binding protein [Bradyrhizobium sp. USDA 3364]